MNILALAAAATASGGAWDYIRIAGAIVFVIILAVMLKRFRGPGSTMEMAVTLIGEIRYNLKVLEKYSPNSSKLKKLKTGTWQKSGERFLSSQAPIQPKASGNAQDKKEEEIPEEQLTLEERLDRSAKAHLKNSISVLDEQTMESMKKAFDMADSYNYEVDKIRRSGATGTIVQVDTAQLIDEFMVCRRGLAAWIKDNYYQVYGRRRGMFW